MQSVAAEILHTQSWASNCSHTLHMAKAKKKIDGTTLTVVVGLLLYHCNNHMEYDSSSNKLDTI